MESLACIVTWPMDDGQALVSHVESDTYRPAENTVVAVRCVGDVGK